MCFSVSIEVCTCAYMNVCLLYMDSTDYFLYKVGVLGLLNATLICFLGLSTGPLVTIN